MRSTDIKKGMKVKVVTLDEEMGIQAAEEHIRARKVGVTGVVVKSYNPDNFAGLWQVKHDSTGVVGVYVYFELEILG